MEAAILFGLKDVYFIIVRILTLQGRAGYHSKKNPENELFSGGNQHRAKVLCEFSFFYPDCTVDTGITPVHARLALVGYTTDRELDLRPHPAPKE